MAMNRYWHLSAVVLPLALIAASGCTQETAETKATHHRERAVAYFDKGGRRKGDRLLFWGFSRPSAVPHRGLQAQGGRGHRLPVGCPEGLLPIHAGAQGREFMIDERLINPREPVGRGLNGSGIAQMRKSEA